MGAGRRGGRTWRAIDAGDDQKMLETFYDEGRWLDDDSRSSDVEIWSRSRGRGCMGLDDGLREVVRGLVTTLEGAS